MIETGIRGMLGNAFSTGVDDFVRGHFSKENEYLLPYTSVNKAFAVDVANRYKRGYIRGPLWMIGHSLGAVKCVDLTDDLIELDVPVRVVVLWDYVWTFSNLFKRRKANSNVPFYHLASNDFRVIDLPGSIRYDYPSLSHIELDNDEGVHKVTEQLIRKHI